MHYIWMRITHETLTLIQTSFYSLYYIKMEKKPRLVKFVDELDFNELEEGQMFTMVDWKLAIINPTEEDRREYYEEQKAEYEMEEMFLAEHDVDQDD